MRLLLDTHILIWYAIERDALLRREWAAISDEATDLLVSSISLWEIRAKVRAERQRGKPQLRLDPTGAVDFCAGANIDVDIVSIADLTAPVLDIGSGHGDMFDEMLLIQAERLGARLLTRDRKLLGHPLSLF